MTKLETTFHSLQAAENAMGHIRSSIIDQLRNVRTLFQYRAARKEWKEVFGDTSSFDDHWSYKTSWVNDELERLPAPKVSCCGCGDEWHTYNQGAACPSCGHNEYKILNIG